MNIHTWLVTLRTALAIIAGVAFAVGVACTVWSRPVVPQVGLVTPHGERAVTQALRGEVVGSVHFTPTEVLTDERSRILGRIVSELYSALRRAALKREVAH